MLLGERQTYRGKCSTESALEEAKCTNGSRQKYKILRIWCPSDEKIVRSSEEKTWFKFNHQSISNSFLKWEEIKIYYAGDRKSDYYSYQNN